MPCPCHTHNHYTDSWLDSALRDLWGHQPATDIALDDLEDQLDIVYGDLERLEVVVAALRTANKARAD